MQKHVHELRGGKTRSEELLEEPKKSKSSKGKEQLREISQEVNRCQVRRVREKKSHEKRSIVRGLITVCKSCSPVLKCLNHRVGSTRSLSLPVGL